MYKATGVAERPTRQVIAELARIIRLPDTTVEQKVEIAKQVAELNRQLVKHKKEIRDRQKKEERQGKAKPSPFS